MLLNEIYGIESNLTPEEIATIIQQNKDRIRANWDNPKTQYTEEQLDRVARRAAEREMRDIAYQRALEKSKNRVPSKGGDVKWDEEKMKQNGERFPGWKIGPDGWGGD